MNTKPKASTHVMQFMEWRNELNAIYRELGTNEFNEWANAFYPNSETRSGSQTRSDFKDAHSYFADKARLANRAVVLAECLEAMATPEMLNELAKYEYEYSVWQSEQRNQITEGK